MAGQVLQLTDVIVEDQLGCAIGNHFIDWNSRRVEKIRDWNEIRRYLFATDTSFTTNSKNPWTNKTTIPQMCFIRDNLNANFLAHAFPRRKWLFWEANRESSADLEKRDAILNFMGHVMSQRGFKLEMAKLILDYIDYGNCFATVEWRDSTQELDNRVQVGYVGPMLVRISPLDIVFNPTAPSFERAPKIVRSVVSMGEIKEILSRLSADESTVDYQKLYNYLKTTRDSVRQYQGEFNLSEKDDYYRIDGFDSFRAYLESDYVELLTFYGDIYNRETDEFLRNHMIMVVDRHKVIAKKPNPSYFGHPPIFHAGWRVRQDNLWAMGPMDNLVGMQYRIDHIENMKADLVDLILAPPIKTKGYVAPFTWGPLARIDCGDDGDAELMSPDAQWLQADMAISSYKMEMEEKAGSPKEALGFRTPGEKTKYEVQRIENAGNRLYQQRSTQFEEQFVEPLLNALLEMGRRNLTQTIEIRVFDDEFKAASFQLLSPDDLTGSGTIRPMAARHFAERAELVQNWTAFYGSGMGQDPNITVHMSGLNQAKMIEEMFDCEEYKIVQPYVRLSEQADQQRLAHALEEQVMMESQTPSGLSADDVDEEFV